MCIWYCVTAKLKLLYCIFILFAYHHEQISHTFRIKIINMQNNSFACELAVISMYFMIYANQSGITVQHQYQYNTTLHGHTF